MRHSKWAVRYQDGSYGIDTSGEKGEHGYPLK